MSEQSDPKPPSSFQGWLSKRGEKGLKLWKKRWFALRNEKMYYFKKQVDNQAPLGSIAIGDAIFIGPTKELNKPNVMTYFEIRMKSGRIYNLWSENQHEAQQWLEVLGQTKRYCDWKVDETARLEREKQERLREEQLAREEAARRPVSMVLNTSSFGELLEKMPEAKDPKAKAIAARLPQPKEEHLFDLQREIEMAASSQATQPEPSPVIRKPDPEGPTILIVNPNAPSTSPPKPVNTSPFIQPTTATTTTFNNQPATAYPSFVPPQQLAPPLPPQNNFNPARHSMMVAPPPSSREEFRPSSYNPHLQNNSSNPIGVFGQLKLGTPSGTPISSPQSSLHNLPEMRLSSDGHLPVGGNRTTEMRSVTGSGSWKKSRAPTEGEYDRDEDDELDAITRCCHISCEVQ